MKRTTAMLKMLPIAAACLAAAPALATTASVNNIHTLECIETSTY